MAQLLDSLVSSFAKDSYKDYSEVERYDAMKALEQQVINEICQDEAERIRRDVKETEELARFETAKHELNVTIIQCVILAAVIGILVSHIYDLLKYLYGATPDYDLQKLAIGVAVFFVIALIIIMSMVVSRLQKALREVLENRRVSR